MLSYCFKCKKNTESINDLEVNDNGPKFKAADHERISKYRNIFAKGHTPNWSEVFLIKKIKNTVR